MVKKKVFVIMPFQNEFFEVYEMLKSKFSEDFEFTNAGDEGNQQNILMDIIQPIYEADIVVADLTGLNPNVMYELGLAHSFNKKTIVITKDDLSQLPFDLKQYRAKDYDTHFLRFEELLNYLKTNLYGAISNEVGFSNPVRDFLRSENINNVPWFAEKDIIELAEENGKGFIDFLAEIEEITEKFTEVITTLTNDIMDMEDGVSKIGDEIERVNKKGGAGTASFVRKEAKKAATHVDNFGKKLNKHIDDLSKIWDIIEVNSAGLLDNEFATSDDNLDNLKVFIDSFTPLKESILESNESVLLMKQSLEKSIGLERSLTQAIKNVCSSFDAYITLTSRFNNSIDILLKKSRFIVK
ncbi:hypothetical protein ACMZ6Z_08730 [Streptococcus pluranimalium]|uniref:hypothetical protein n=1 Tax=Streptococcus pluranimalium TaxID=82348 RepID=UPI0039FC3A9C